MDRTEPIVYFSSSSELTTTLVSPMSLWRYAQPSSICSISTGLSELTLAAPTATYPPKPGPCSASALWPGRVSGCGPRPRWKVHWACRRPRKNRRRWIASLRCGLRRSARRRRRVARNRPQTSAFALVQLAVMQIHLREGKGVDWMSHGRTWTRARAFAELGCWTYCRRWACASGGPECGGAMHDSPETKARYDSPAYPRLGIVKRIRFPGLARQHEVRARARLVV